MQNISNSKKMYVGMTTEELCPSAVNFLKIETLGPTSTHNFGKRISFYVALSSLTPSVHLSNAGQMINSPGLHTQAP